MPQRIEGDASTQREAYRTVLLACVGCRYVFLGGVPKKNRAEGESGRNADCRHKNEKVARNLPDETTLAVVLGSPSSTSTATGCRINGGTPGVAERVTNRAVFSDGRTLDAELDVYTR